MSENSDIATKLNSKNIPKPPNKIKTNQLILSKGIHVYQCYNVQVVDSISLHAHKRALRLLALSILSKVFHNKPKLVKIQLTHPNSQIKNIILNFNQHSYGQLTSYKTKPNLFEYEPKMAFNKSDLSFFDFKPEFHPSFSVTNKAGDAGLEVELDGKTAEHNIRDTVYCAGSEFGHITFAELLLNLSQPECTLDELVLENEYGYGGVAKGSAELHYWAYGHYFFSNIFDVTECSEEASNKK